MVLAPLGMDLTLEKLASMADHILETSSSYQLEPSTHHQPQLHLRKWNRFGKRSIGCKNLSSPSYHSNPGSHADILPPQSFATHPACLNPITYPSRLYSLLVPPMVWRCSHKMKLTTSQKVKRYGQMLAATGISGLIPSHLFYVTDRACGLRFLVDTGAELSVIAPVSAEQKTSTHLHTSLTLQVVNSSSITTFGTRSLSLDLRRTFRGILSSQTLKRPS